MAVDITLLNSNSLENIQTNFERVETALQDTIGRSGSLPNQMNADFDMNNNDILNVKSIDTDILYINGEPVVPSTLGTLPDNSVGSSQIIDGSVGTSELTDGSVNTAKLADNSVSEPKLTRSLSARTGALFDTVAELIADTSLTYLNVSVGDIIEAQGFRYEVAASAATDEHVTTAGSVKLYVLPGVKGYPAPAFGAIGDGTVGHADMLAACTKLWGAALANEQDMYFPAGFYEIADANFPWRQSDASGGILYCNVTLYVDGPETIFATNTADGADVFQLNGLGNFRVVGFPTLTSTLTATENSGSNGCSITGGFDNLYLELTCTNLPSVDATSFVDGGKALSIQPVATANPCGKLIAKVRAKGCAYAFGTDLNLDTMATKGMSVQIDLEAEDCFRAVVISGAAATGALSEDFDLGITVRGHAINCQQDVFLARAHGVRVDMSIVTTKSAADRRLDPNGVAWLASDTVVEALQAAYAQHCVVNITGNKGECDYKARIGGTAAGSSGLTGRTLSSYFGLDIGGVAATGDIVAINSGGNISANCVFDIDARTTNEAGVDALLKNATYGNLFDFAGTFRMVSPKVADALLFAFSADGVTETGRIDLFGSVTGLQGKGTSVANAPVTGLYDNAGNLRFAARNGPGFVVNSLSDASASSGSHVGRLILYNDSNVAIGAIDVNTV